MDISFSLPPMIKGILLMLMGILILLHTLGIFQQSISTLLILISIGLIIVGFIEADGISFVKKLLNSAKR